MTNSVHIRINLSAGEVDVEAPVENLQDVISKTEGLFSRLITLFDPATEPIKGRRNGNPPDEQKGGPPDEAKAGLVPDETRKGKSKSSGKKETYSTVSLGIDVEQRQSFKTFYSDKKPSGQNDQVITIMYWLQENAGISLFNKDQLATGFRTVGEKVPGKISSVLSNLMGKGWVVSRGSGNYGLTHVAEDRVVHDLPKQEKGK
jgi:hypothetical protein